MLRSESNGDGESPEKTMQSAWRLTNPVLIQLHRTFARETYLDYLQEIRSEGYRLYATVDASELVDVPGLTIRTNFYRGRHLSPDCLLIRPSLLSEGLGSRMVGSLERGALEGDFETPTPESGPCRENVHRFFKDRNGMDLVNYSFRRPLERPGISS